MRDDGLQLKSEKRGAAYAASACFASGRNSFNRKKRRLKMKENYLKPIVEVWSFDEEDVICASGGDQLTDENGRTEFGQGDFF